MNKFFGETTALLYIQSCEFPSDPLFFIFKKKEKLIIFTERTFVIQL